MPISRCKTTKRGLFFVLNRVYPLRRQRDSDETEMLYLLEALSTVKVSLSVCLSVMNDTVWVVLKGTLSTGGRRS